MIRRVWRVIAAKVPNRRQFWPNWETHRLGLQVRIAVWLLGIAVLLGVQAISHAIHNHAVASVQAVTLDQSADDGTLAIVGASETNLYDTPAGTIIRVLAPGAVLTAFGRSADNQWIVVSTGSASGDSSAGWVESSQVVIFGLDQLPIMLEGTVQSPGNSTTPIALPTPTPTPTPTQTPTVTPTMSPTSIPSPTATPMTLPPTENQQASEGNANLASTGVVAVVRGGGALMYAEPNGELLLELTTGAAVTALASTADASWIYVRTSDDQRGWVQVGNIVAFELSDLPIIETGDASVDSESIDAVPILPDDGNSDAGDEVARANESDPEATAIPNSNTESIRATVALTDSRLNVRSGPGIDFAILGQILPREEFTAIGRDTSGAWIFLLTPDMTTDSGWVSAEFITLTGPISDLPVVATVIPATESETDSPDVPLPASSLTAATAESTATGSATRGKLVVQSTPGGLLYVYEFNTGALYQLTSGFDPAISPDGQTVAFTRITGELGLYLIDIDGSNERRIYVGETLRGPTWSLDGAWIAFTRAAGSYQCRELGFGICLPDNSFLNDFPLVTKPERGLSRVDINGQNFRDLPALTSVAAPDWGAGGIVYHTNTSLEITQDLPDATTAALLVAPYYQTPVWQPNGDRVLFQSREGSHWEIFTVNSDGSGLAALTRPATALVDKLPSNVAPAWSPDGQYIAFLSNRTDANSAGDWRLWVMNADGTDQRPLAVGVTFDYDYTGAPMLSWGP